MVKQKALQLSRLRYIRWRNEGNWLFITGFIRNQNQIEGYSIFYIRGSFYIINTLSSAWSIYDLMMNVKMWLKHQKRSKKLV